MVLSWWLKSRKGASVASTSRRVSGKRVSRPPMRLEALEDRLTPTTAISFVNNVLTINVSAANETATLSESGGNLSISSNDAGGTTADGGAQALGFSAATAQNTANTGSIAPIEDVRLITITGAAGTQTVDMAGGNFTATNINDGLIENVSFLTAPSTFTDISGNGASDLSIATTSLTLGESLTSGGTITLAVGQATTETAGATLTADALLLQGSGSYALDNINDVGTLAATTSGAISFNNGANALDVGMVATIDGVTTTNSGVTITADDLTIAQPIGVGPATVFLQPFTNTLPIQLGAIAVPGVSFGLTDADLSEITAGSLQIGSTAETGGISVVGAISRHGFATLDLTTGNATANAVTQTASLAVSHLDVQAAGAVTLTNGANFVDSIAGSTVAGDFDFLDNASVFVGRITPSDPTFGINAAGNVIVTTTAGNSTPGNITLPWTVEGDTVTLTAAGAILADDSNVNFPANKVSATDLVLSSTTGTGAAALALATNVGNLVALNTTSGGIFISNDGPLTIGFAGDPFQGVSDHGNGDPISVTSAGTLTITTTGEVINAAAGDVTLTTTAGDIVTGGNQEVVNIGGDSALATLNAAGDITLGVSGASGSVEGGGPVVLTAGGNITVDNGSTVQGFGNGNGVTITAGGNIIVQATTVPGASIFTAGDGTASSGGAISLTTGANGNFVLESGANGDVDSDGGNITISAGGLFTADPITTGSSTAGIVTLRQAGTTTLNLDLGTDPSTGNLGLSQTDLNQVTANILRIGRTDNSGNITLTAQITQPATVGTALTLLTGGNIQNMVSETSPAIIATNLMMQAGTGIGGSQSFFPFLSTQVSQVAGSTSTSGGILIVNNSTGDLIIGTVDGVSGLSATVNGPVNVETLGGLTLSQPINAPATALTGSGAININSTITGDGATINGGDGPDVITVTTTGATPLTLNGQGGGDSYVIGFGFGLLQSPVNIDASGTGTNTVTLNTASNSADIVTALPGQVMVTGPSGETVNYSGVQALIINGAVSYIVGGTADGTPTTINAEGSTAENVLIGDIDLPTPDLGFASLLTINAQGTNMGMIIEPLSNAGETFNFSPGSITGEVAINYTGINAIEVAGGTGSNTFNITPSTTTSLSIGNERPASPNSPGNTLNLNLAGITNPTLGVEFENSFGFTGTWTFGNAQPVQFSDIAILSPGPAAITSANTTTFVAGQQDSFTVTTSASPTASLTETGALPGGVTFVDNQNGTATLAGTTTTTGAFSFTITASNGLGANATQNFTLTINAVTSPVFSPTAANLQFSSARFAPNPTGSPLVALVQGFYNNVLGRAGDLGGINAWVGALAAGIARSQVVSAFWDSIEHRQNEVNSYYQYYLGRTESPAEQLIWVNQLVSGQSENNVVLQFLNSPEYSQLHTSNADFVNALYAQVLGRLADPNGFNVFFDLLNAGAATRAFVATDILFSNEANFLAINSYYLAALARQGSATEIEAWLQVANGGLPLGNIAQDFLGSDEYAFDAAASV